MIAWRALFTRRWRGARVQVVEHTDDFGTHYIEPMYRIDDVKTARLLGLIEQIEKKAYERYLPREAYAVMQGDEDNEEEEIRFMNLADLDEFDPPLRRGIYKQVLRDIADLKPFWTEIADWMIRDLREFVVERERAEEPIKRDIFEYRRPSPLPPPRPKLKLRVARSAQHQGQEKKPQRISRLHRNFSETE